MAKTQTTDKIDQPHTPRKLTKQNGAYDPAINKNIADWSTVWKIFFHFGVRMVC